MANEPEEKMAAGPDGIAAFEEMQEVYEKWRLTAKDGVCIAADFFVWVMMMTFQKKEHARVQAEAMLPGILANIDANWESLESRRQMIAALNRGESGGRLQ